MFPLVSEAVAKIIPVAKLRWLTIVHLESDECGSMNEWLAAAPQAEIMWSDWNVRFWHKADIPITLAVRKLCRAKQCDVRFLVVAIES